jgi:hypothetical protein
MISNIDLEIIEIFGGRYLKAIVTFANNAFAGLARFDEGADIVEAYNSAVDVAIGQCKRAVEFNYPDGGA